MKTQELLVCTRPIIAYMLMFSYQMSFMDDVQIHITTNEQKKISL